MSQRKNRPKIFCILLSYLMNHVCVFVDDVVDCWLLVSVVGE